jgi:hypothetical protein
MSTGVADNTAGRKALRLRLLRRRREARIRFWRVFAVSTFFVVALSGNMFIGAMALQQNFGDLFTFDKLFSWGKTPEPAPTARIRRPLLDGVFCRNIVFDNKTSQAVSDKVERCDKVEPQKRGRAPTQFTWGK